MFPWSLISWGAVWLIALITVSSFFKSPVLKIAPVLFVSLLLKFRPGFDPQNAVFAVASLIGVVSFEGLPFDKRVNLFVANLIGLVLFLILMSFLR